MSSSLSEINRSSTVKYFIQRPPRWTDTAPALAAQVYAVHKSAILHSSHGAKLIWDKLWHMGNQAKATGIAEKYKDEATCSSCGEEDSHQHWNKLRSSCPSGIGLCECVVLSVGKFILLLSYLFF